MPDQAPFVSRYTLDNDAVATAGNSQSKAIKIPVAGVVQSVSYVPYAALSGANTNSRTLNVIQHGQTGAAGVTVASLALVSGVNLVAFDEKDVTVSGTAANLVVAAGDVLEFQSLAVGTGIVDPGGQVEIVVARTA